MILGLSDRVSPLDLPPSRLARLARVGRLCFSLAFVLACAAAAWKLAPSNASSPRPASASPYGPERERFRVARRMPLYSEPWNSSEIRGWLEKGAVVRVLRNEVSWLFVESELGPGWLEIRVPPPRSARPLPSSSRPSAPLPAPTAPPLLPELEPLPPSTPSVGPSPTPLSRPEQIARGIEEGRGLDPSVLWARSMLSSHGLHPLETEHFRLWTDVEDPEFAGRLLGLAEQTLQRFEELFRPHFELQDLVGKSELFVFRSQRDYLEFYRLFAHRRATRPAGHYSPDIRAIALSRQTEEGNSVEAILVHEMVHLLLDQRLYLEAAHGPAPWIGEGLATDFASTLGAQSNRIAGVETRRDPFQLGRMARMRIAGLRQDLASGTAVRIPALLEAGLPEFDGPEALRYYDSAWLWCHFLLDKRPELLMDAIRADLDGKPAPEALLQLDGPWAASVRFLSRAN